MNRGRARAIVLLVVLSAALGAWPFAIYTRLGIFAVGHRYWLWQASRAESEDARRESLGRVLNATQYVVNQAESYVRGIQDRRLRIRLWRTLIDTTPNDSWIQHYTRNLQSEAETCHADVDPATWGGTIG